MIGLRLAALCRTVLHQASQPTRLLATQTYRMASAVHAHASEAEGEQGAAALRHAPAVRSRGLTALINALGTIITPPSLPLIPPLSPLPSSLPSAVGGDCEKLVMAAQLGMVPRLTNAAKVNICQFKVVLLGDVAVGKSSLVLRFSQGSFKDHHEATIGAAFLSHTVNLDDTTVKFEIWDTAGQERYESLAPMYYRGAQAAIVVYDITNNKTFARAKFWVKELRRQASPNVLIVLAGNKADLASNRKVDFEDAQIYAERNSLLFMETSAKSALNVDDMFLAIAMKLPKPMPGRQRQRSFVLEQSAEERGGACCIRKRSKK